MNKKIVSYLFLVLLLLSLIPFASPIVGAATTSVSLSATADGSINTGLVNTSDHGWDDIKDDDELNVRNGGGNWYMYGTFIFSDHTTQIGSIVNVTVVSKLGNDSSNSKAKHNILIGSTVYNGSEISINAPGGTSTTKYYNTSWTTDPSTSLAWTWSAVDNAQFGVGLKSGTFGYVTHCTFLYVKVYYSYDVYTNASTGITNTTATFNGYQTGSNSATCGFWYNYSGSAKINVTATGTYNNGETFSKSVTGLIPGKRYRVNSWTISALLGYRNATDYKYFYTYPSKPTGLNYFIKSGSTFINITWTVGVGSTYTRIQRATASQPVTISDGTNVQNNTKTYYNLTSLTQPYYFTLFAYNNSLYSGGANLSWYVVWVNTYNETSGVALTNWNIFITNATGTQTYNKTGCNNPTLINVSNIPKGTGCTIQVSKTNFTTRVTTVNIVITGNYYISSYLAHFTPPTVPPTNTSYLYLLSVVNEYTSPVQGALLTVKRVVGASYVAVTSGLTDGLGQFSCYLVPGAFYKFFITKEGYANETADWTPSDSLFTHSFMIYAAPSPDTVLTNITLSIEPTQTNFDNSFTVYYNITSSDSKLVWFNATVSRYNTTTGVWLLLYGHKTTSTTGGTISYTIANITGSYRFRCGYEKTGFTEYTTSVYYSIVWTPYTNDTLNFTVTKIVGRSPIYIPTLSGETVASYTALIAAFISIFVLFGFSPKFSGLAVMATGGILGFCKSPLGLITNDVLTYVACGFIIILGVLMVMAEKKEGEQ